MTKPEDYKWIRMWGRMMGSYEYYIMNEQMKALKEGAPLDAIYQESPYSDKDPGKWHTVAEIDNPSTRARLTDCAPSPIAASLSS